MLLGWANLQFGFRSNRELFDVLKDAEEGYHPDGRSHVGRMLGSRKQCAIPSGDLARYDDNVRRHLASMNAGRREPITLRYFQQLAALYAELFLDRRAAAPEALARDIDRYVREKVRLMPVTYPVKGITPADLNKLAFWMATGSGKTLIMHLNYLQFLHYGGAEGLDNIILITPNEGLSAQHMTEMEASGIPSARFGETGLLAGHRRTVRVTEITKLAERKKGKGTGVSIEVQALGDRNLVFVDEGHRGASGEAWRAVRDAVAARGFTFEYSATFGQALAAARDNRLTLDYGKSIVFDYSYRYFHGDGFGKDFRVLNVTGADPPRELTDRLLLGNLLSFHEQLCAHRDNAAALRAYNLEPPLWVFVGRSVNAVYRRNRRDTSDVLDVQLFLHRVLSEPAWAKDAIARLLRGESGLYSAWQVDLFAGRFDELAKSGGSPGRIYGDLLKTFFHTDGPGGLRLCDIRGAPGELGLKAAGSDHYFGLTYIGDTPRFKKLALKADAGIVMEEDAVGGSMFGRVNEAGATVNVLIGAKKFVEGWNSWRVSNMGLMNVGTGEGSEIIQLFGRGVRLKGRGMSLKRSTHLEGPHPDKVGLLETLNIFALRADYMNKFRQYLEQRRAGGAGSRAAQGAGAGQRGLSGPGAGGSRRSRRQRLRDGRQLHARREWRDSCADRPRDARVLVGERGQRARDRGLHRPRTRRRRAAAGARGLGKGVPGPDRTPPRQGHAPPGRPPSRSSAVIRRECERHSLGRRSHLRTPHLARPRRPAGARPHRASQVRGQMLGDRAAAVGGRAHELPRGGRGRPQPAAQRRSRDGRDPGHAPAVALYRQRPAG